MVRDGGQGGGGVLCEHVQAEEVDSDAELEAEITRIEKAVDDCF